MTIRTLKFYASTTDPKSKISVKIDDEQVYLGLVDMFTYEVDIAFAGQLALELEVLEGYCVLNDILGNYVDYINPNFSEEDRDYLRDPANTREQKAELFKEFPQVTSEVLDYCLDPATTEDEVEAKLREIGLSYNITSGPDKFMPICDNADACSDVTINGDVVSKPAGAPVNFTGHWFYPIMAGSTLKCNVNVIAGCLI